MAPLSNFLEKYSMQRIVCLFPLHTLTLHRLLVLHQSTCFLINYFRDASYQNQAARSLPPPNGHLQAGLRKRKMQYPLLSWKIFFFLQKREICEEQHWHQIKDFFLGNQRMTSTEHCTSEEPYQSLIWSVQAAHWVLNHLDFPWSKLSF